MQYAAAPGTYMGNSPSTLATYSFLTWRVRICVSISRAFAGFRPNISSPEVSRSSLQQYTYHISVVLQTKVERRFAKISQSRRRPLLAPSLG